MDTEKVLIIIVSSFVFGLGTSLLFRKRNPWGVPWIFFMLVFFAAWAGTLWIKPVGPAIKGVSLMPPFAASLLAGVLIAASSSESNIKNRKKDNESIDTGITVSSFVWVMLIILVFFVISGYVGEA